MGAKDLTLGYHEVTERRQEYFMLVVARFLGKFWKFVK